MNTFLSVLFCVIVLFCVAFYSSTNSSIPNAIHKQHRSLHATGLHNDKQVLTTSPYELFLSDLLQQYGYTGLHKDSSEGVESLKYNGSRTNMNFSKYIFGFSTGHAGSTSVHAHFKSHCNSKGESIFKFELPSRDFLETFDQDYDTNDPCKFTREELLPLINRQMKQTAEQQFFFDLGHFYNMPPSLECLALYLGPDATFVRIRRNRHDIAHSFTDMGFKTTCVREDAQSLDNYRSHPVLSYCPIARKNAAPVPLQIEQSTWKSLEPFQRFLWMTDDLEVRWQYMRMTFIQSHFEEITWSDGYELAEGMQKMDSILGCRVDAKEDSKTNTVEKARKQHVSHTDKSRSCEDEIHLDLEYRKLMNYDDSVQKILFQDQTQYIHLKECEKSEKQLQNEFQTVNFIFVEESKFVSTKEEVNNSKSKKEQKEQIVIKKGNDWKEEAMLEEKEAEE